MPSHRVCVVQCPHCEHEKVLTRLRQRTLLWYQCKKCKKIIAPRDHQTCFKFEGMSPVNAL